MKKVIVTGASRGIGFKLIQLFAANQYKVLALSRNIEPIKSLNNSNINYISCDLSKEEDLQEVSDFISSEWSEVNILINNAGALLNKPFMETTSEEFENVYKVNVFGVAETTRRVLPFMPKDGHVVNVSSMGGVQGSVKFPGLSAYSSSKGAVITLTELLAEEYKETGPLFNVLAIGAVQTEMLEEAFPGYKAPLSALEMAQYIYDFAREGHKFYNGKMLQVSNSTP